MTGGLKRILVCAWLVFAMSQASAEEDWFSGDYRWITLFGNTGDLVLPLGFGSSASDTALVRVANRTSIELDTERAYSYIVRGSGNFRQPDPEFGLPQAFRQPRQARLAFRIAF